VPRYHFNIRDGRSHADTDGTILPSLEAARIEAVRLSGELLRESPETFWSSAFWEMEVADERGLILFTLHFSSTDAPATMRV
jgi:uncharacterized protein DUF6894